MSDKMDVFGKWRNSRGIELEITDGCGHIAEDGFWYNAPCPDALLQYQIEWAENGVPA